MLRNVAFRAAIIVFGIPILSIWVLWHVAALVVIGGAWAVEKLVHLINRLRSPNER